MILAVGSEPEADPGNDAGPRRVVADGARELRRAADLALPDIAQIEREFAGELIAQAQAQFGTRCAWRADTLFAHVLKRDVQFRRRLQDQALGDALVVAPFDTGGDIALVRQGTAPLRRRTNRGESFGRRQRHKWARGPGPTS